MEGYSPAAASGGTAVPSLVEICVLKVKTNVTTLDLVGCNEDVISRIINTLEVNREVTGQSLKKLLTSSSSSLRSLAYHRCLPGWKHYVTGGPVEKTPRRSTHKISLAFFTGRSGFASCRHATKSRNRLWL